MSGGQLVFGKMNWAVINFVAKRVKPGRQEDGTHTEDRPLPQGTEGKVVQARAKGTGQKAGLRVLER